MNQVFDFLAGQYMFDMYMFGTWWPLAPFYAVWFIVKWAFLTAPISIPLSAFRSVSACRND